MNRQIICIACPRGCILSVRTEADPNNPVITGNKCPKGIEYGRQEVLSPERMLTTTVKTANGNFPRLPVRLSREIPRALIFDCMRIINRLTVDHNCRPGDVLIPNILDTGADLIATGELIEKRQ